MKIQVIPEAIEICLSILEEKNEELTKQMPKIIFTEKEERLYEECEHIQIGLQHGIRLLKKIKYQGEMEFK